MSTYCLVRKSRGLISPFVIAFGLSLGLSPAYAQDRTAPSVVKAEAEATLASVLAGTILELPFDLGDRFGKDDLLMRLDCSIQEAEAAAARSESEAAQVDFVARSALLARGGIGRAEVQVAAANAAATQAVVERAEAILDGCELRAPFDGYVSDRLVNRYEYVQSGEQMLSIVSAERPKLQIIAPSVWLRWMKPGQRGRFRLEAAEGDFTVSVSTIGATVDPVSRTVTLEADFDGDVRQILPGMSGLVQFE